MNAQSNENYPISELDLLPNEIIVWQKGQGTFHRFYDWHFAVTNLRVMIFYHDKLFRPLKWYIFNVNDIEKILIEDLAIYWRFLFFWNFRKNAFPRTQIHILCQNNSDKSATFLSDNDDYQDERIFDRKLVLEWLNAIRQHHPQITINDLT